MKVSVTGANGYIGRHVVRSLMHRGCDITAVVRDHAEIDSGVRVISGDILANDRDWYDVTGRPDIVIHLAWRDGFAHNAESHLDDFPKHCRFLRGLVEAGLKHLVVMGSAHEIGYYEGAINEYTPTNPRAPYGIAKNALRQFLFSHLEDRDVILQWIRGFYITGDDRHNHSLFTRVLEMNDQGKHFFPFTDGESKFDFIDVKMLAEQIVSVAVQTDVTGIINCCSGRPRKIKDVVLQFLSENNLSIRPEFGKFPKRSYESPITYGDTDKIEKIMNGNKHV